MTFRSQKLRDASNGQACVRCGNTQGVVGAHYTGVRRLKLGGGYGIKVHDFLTADLCQGCHSYMDTISREKEKRYGHSEEFLYYIALTWERRFLQGVIVVAKPVRMVAGTPSEARSGDASPGDRDVQAPGQAATGAAV